MTTQSTTEPVKSRTKGLLAYLLITAVLCGGLIMVIEVLGSRVIGPFFGVSLFVWTSLIAVTLVALALGYACGGLLADRRGTPEMLYTIIGIAGMLVTEIDLVGIVQDASGGDVAFFTGSDNKGYFMKVGDRTFDAALIGVDPRTGAVTFRQEVDDPRLIKPYRDVVKKLSPLEES